MSAYLFPMRKVLALCLILAAPPVAAQDTPLQPTPPQPTPPLSEQLEGLMQRFLERVLPPMEQGLQAIEPDLRDLMTRLQGMAQYEAPEILPNGDILIRRKPPADHLPDKDAPSGPPITSPLEL
jgi:hypothetical protein